MKVITQNFRPCHGFEKASSLGPRTNHKTREKSIDPAHDERLRYHHGNIAFHHAHHAFHRGWIGHWIRPRFASALWIR